MVFRWRNDPFLVARASSQKSVTWEEHVRWFQETITGIERKMFIVLVDGVPAGQVRFERLEADACVISAYMLEPYTGRGLGVEAIQKACGYLFEDWAVRNIVAFVREDNLPSQSGFRKAGFDETQEAAACPPKHLSLILQRAEHPKARVAAV
jgi:RimJ/RimL family protein N-acetyltransferase